MARPRLSDTEKKGERLTVRFRPGELNELSEQADMSGLSVSELIRRRAMQMRVVSVTDLKMLSELRRIGGLMKHLFNETNGLYRQKTAELLSELHAAVVRVGRKREDE
ncbi:MAG: MobB mobilization protein [Treponema sp.]|nr:MobB mobilization protein [Treponema sp.]